MLLAQGEKLQGPGDRAPRGSNPKTATGKLVNVTIYRVALRMLMRPSPLVEKNGGLRLCRRPPPDYGHGLPLSLWQPGIAMAARQWCRLSGHAVVNQLRLVVDDVNVVNRPPPVVSSVITTEGQDHVLGPFGYGDLDDHRFVGRVRLVVRTG